MHFADHHLVLIEKKSRLQITGCGLSSSLLSAATHFRSLAFPFGTVLVPAVLHLLAVADTINQQLKTYLFEFSFSELTV